MTNFKEIQISEIFDVYSWDKLRKIHDLKWEFPVISAQSTNNWVIWYTNNPYFLDCNNENLYITFWDHTKYIKVRSIPFSTTDAVKVLKIKNKYENKINLNYIIKSWQILMPNLWYTRYWKHVKDIFIKLPLNENWEFDLEKQKEIALKYEKLEKLKDRIRIMKEDLENQKIEIISKWNFIEKKLEEIFDLSINTNHSKFTKTFVELNKWDIPVYSASKSENLVWYWYIKDNVEWVKYFENCLTWNIDWSVWKSFYRKWKFSLSEKVIPLVLFDEYKISLDLFYIKYSIEVGAKKEWFWFTKKAWKWRIKDLILKIPTNENWEFNLEKQKEIALKYEKLEKIQKTLIEELEYLEKVKVEI